jgi:hypothetical protein
MSQLGGILPFGDRDANGKNAQIAVIPERVSNGSIRLTVLRPQVRGPSFGSIALGK